MSEYPMTLDELHGACKEASDLGKPIELDALTAQSLVEDCIDYNAAIIRLETMLGHGADGGPSMDTMLDEVRAIVADFAALKVQVIELQNRHRDYSKVNPWHPDYTMALRKVSDTQSALFGLIDRLEPTRPSPVLEIAGINHE